MINGLFITIHGIDGTGKTSAAENVAHSLFDEGVHATYYDALPNQPTPELVTGNPTIDKKLAQSALISGYLGEGTAIVRDRWLIDVFADNGFQGKTVEASAGILIPNYSFVLTCQDDTRMQRIHARGNPTKQDLIENKEGTRAHFFENYLIQHIGAFAHNSLIIDTTDLTKDEVAKHIIRTVL